MALSDQEIFEGQMGVPQGGPLTPSERAELAELERLEAEHQERLERDRASRTGNLTPEEWDELTQLEAEVAQLEAQQLASQVDPNTDFLPQALAVQPATTHPGGEEGAVADWMSGAGGEGVYVYEPPLEAARKELLEKPQMMRALFPSDENPEEYVRVMDEGSGIYRAYSDLKWAEASNAARRAGKTAYRYSRMPWLQGDAAGLNPISSLSMKLRGGINPLTEGMQSFVLGVDDSGFFGLGKRGGEAIARAMGSSAHGISQAAGDLMRGGEAVGGVSGEVFGGADPEAVNEMLAEENPGLHTAGRVAGLFTPGGIAGRLWGMLGKGTTAAAKALGGGALRQGATRVALSAPAAALGAGAEQTAREVIDAAGDGDTTFEGAAERVAEAATDPLNMVLGAGGEALGQAAKGAVGLVRDSKRYGNVRRVEDLGGKVELGKGPVGTPEAERAIERAKKLDTTPVDVLAGELAPKIAKVEKEIAAGESAVAKGSLEQAKLAKEQGNKAHAEFKDGFFRSREGQRAIAPQETLGLGLKMLRKEHMPRAGGGLEPIGTAKGVKNWRAQFNADIETASLKPSPGAIELTPDEAEAFLSSRHTAKLVSSRGANKQGVNVLRHRGAESPFERELRALRDDTPLPASEAKLSGADPGLALALKKRGVSKVYVNPRRYDAQGHEVRISQLKTLAKNPQMPGAREAAELYAAALKDRQQRSLGGKPGGWAEVQKGFSDRLTGLDQTIEGAEKAATKKAASVPKKTPDAAHKRLVRYSQQRPGELPLKQKTEELAERAGAEPELRTLRLLDPLQALREQASLSHLAEAAGRSALRGAIGAGIGGHYGGLAGAAFGLGPAADPLMLRLGYPALNYLGGLNALRGGMAARPLELARPGAEDEGPMRERRLP